uniref:Uncharacterized protein n=1 Tax=Meloidogyne incognita TaxID=6306 RepID=A0A914L768_MELIC
MKVKQASLSGKNAPMEYFHFSSSINGGLLFHFITDNRVNYRGFEIHFSRKSENNARNLPCPQPFQFATNIPQYLPVFPLEFLGTCIISINSTQEIKLTIRALSESELFGIEVLKVDYWGDGTGRDKSRVGPSKFSSDSVSGFMLGFRMRNLGGLRGKVVLLKRKKGKELFEKSLEFQLTPHIPADYVWFD